MRFARMALAAISHVGRRPNNEDFHRLLPLEVPQGVLLLLAVADGIGGLERGELASKLAIEALTEAVRAYADHLRRGQTVVGLPRVMEKAFALAQRRVEQEGKGMGTTLTAFLYADWLKEGVVGHVGDSRAYLLKPQGPFWQPIQLTQDHSWVAEWVKEGKLRPEEAERHPYRHVLTQALGLRGSVFDFQPVRLLPGEGVLLSTDGLYGEVPETRWRIGRDLQASLEALLAEALKGGGGDNISAVAFRLEG